MIAGTSTVIIGWSSELRFDPESRYLVTPMADSGIGLELDLMSTGSALTWLSKLLGLGGAEELADLAAEASLHEAPLVLPYFGPGEQGALWDPSLTGLIEGVTLRTGRADLARGLLAGIVLEAARCVAVLREAQGDGVHGVILLTGSSGASLRFRQDLADATGLPVRFNPAERDHSAVGAALFAGRSALGWADDPSMPAGIEVLPDPAQAQLWKDRFSRHERARSALRARTIR
jgi:sugar (pentulose or hexulose) kinase